MVQAVECDNGAFVPNTYFCKSCDALSFGKLFNALHLLLLYKNTNKKSGRGGGDDRGKRMHFEGQL